MVVVDDTLLPPCPPGGGVFLTVAAIFGRPLFRGLVGGVSRRVPTLLGVAPSLRQGSYVVRALFCRSANIPDPLAPSFLGAVP